MIAFCTDKSEVVACSFDVFDTVLTRVYARPSDLFATVAKTACVPNISETEFRCLRIQAERQAREASNSEEITLDDIYTQLCKLAALDINQLDRLRQTEIDLEKDSVRPVPGILAAIRKAHLNGRRVIFISDMYLPRNIVREMLEANQAIAAEDSLYVSSDVGKTKHTGKLFLHCLEQEQLLPNSLSHIGDNPISDVHSPRALGIKATHFTDTRLNRYEQTIVEANVAQSSEARSLIAGAARLTRLENPFSDQHRNTIWNTGASVAGPILTAFVTWLLFDALDNSINRLYFIARDGQILHKIACTICNKLSLPLECRYLHGSRQAWHLPAVTTFGDFEYDWILAPTDFLSVKTVLSRVGLHPVDVQDILTEAGLPPHTWNADLSRKERYRLENLIKLGQLHDRILTRSEEAYSLAIDYLAEQGLLDTVDYAIVDIGWNGRLQRSLGNILKRGGHERPLSGYYFGLRARVAPRRGDSLKSYFWDREQSKVNDAIAFKTRALMEVFTAANHGGVIGYKRESDATRPVLRSFHDSRTATWGINIQHESIECYVRKLAPDTLHSLNDKNWCSVWADLLHNFYDFPTVSEAHTYGSFPVTADQNESKFQVLAKEFTPADIVRAICTGSANHHRDEWRPAAKAMTKLPIYAGVRLTEKITRLLGKPQEQLNIQ